MRNWHLFLILAYILLPLPQAYAQPGNSAPATDCDTFAASPYDPEKVGDGVLPAQIDSEKAIPACENALGKYPDERRFKYQLARALHASDPKRAAELYRKLADEGHAPSMVNLSALMARGRGIPQDKAKAFELLQRAADTGFPFGLYVLGLGYRNGFYGPQDKVLAVQLLRKAADLGIADALASLVIMYANGEVTTDKAEAAAVYREAAGKGDSFAMYRVAYSYEKGEGVQQDKAEAARFYRQASNRGQGAAAFNLAMLYARGDGVEANREEAQKLFQRAIELGYPPASKEDASRLPAPDNAAAPSKQAVEKPKGYIGIKAVALPPSHAEAAALKEGTALVVIALTKDGPAEKAGVNIGDIILLADGMPISGPKGFEDLAGTAGEGYVMPLSIQRGPEGLNIKVPLAGLEEKKRLRD